MYSVFCFAGKFFLIILRLPQKGLPPLANESLRLGHSDATITATTEINYTLPSALYQQSNIPGSHGIYTSTDIAEFCRRRGIRYDRTSDDSALPGFNASDAGNHPLALPRPVFGGAQSHLLTAAKIIHTPNCQRFPAALNSRLAWIYTVTSTYIAEFCRRRQKETHICSHRSLCNLLTWIRPLKNNREQPV